MTEKKSNAEPTCFLLAVISYLIIGVSVLHYYQYQINPDGITIISVAQKYMRGDFKNAVNGCWGPLFSWLLIPFLAAKIIPLSAVKILNLLLGFFSFFAIRALADKMELGGIEKCITYFVLVPLMLYFAYFLITQDVLFVLMLIMYFNYMFRDDYPESPLNGLLCGFFGSLAYLAKNYGFPFFLLHFFIMNALRYLSSNSVLRKKIIKNFLSGFLIFIFICGLWIAAISTKYGELTYSVAGKLEWMSIGPEMENRIPVLFDGLKKPPNDTAVSAWEDFADYESRLPRWSPFSSLYNLDFFRRLVTKNIVDISNHYHHFSVFSFSALFIYILICLSPPGRPYEHREIYPIVTALIFPAGYFVCHIEARYLWPVDILILLMCGRLLTMLFAKIKFPKYAVFLIFFIVYFSFIGYPVSGLRANVNINKSAYDTAIQLKKLGVGGKIASNSMWAPSLYIAYHLGAQYYGQLSPNASQEENIKALRDNDIDYLLDWIPDENGNPSLTIKDLKQRTQNKEHGIDNKFYNRSK